MIFTLQWIFDCCVAPRWQCFGLKRVNAVKRKAFGDTDVWEVWVRSEKPKLVWIWNAKFKCPTTSHNITTTIPHHTLTAHLKGCRLSIGRACVLSSRTKWDGADLCVPAGRHHQQLQEEEVWVEIFLLYGVHLQASEQVRQEKSCNRLNRLVMRRRDFLNHWPTCSFGGTFILPQFECVLFSCARREVHPLSSHCIV